MCNISVAELQCSSYIVMHCFCWRFGWCVVCRLVQCKEGSTTKRAWEVASLLLLYNTPTFDTLPYQTTSLHLQYNTCPYNTVPYDTVPQNGILPVWPFFIKILPEILLTIMQFLQAPTIGGCQSAPSDRNSVQYSSFLILFPKMGHY